MRDRSLQQMVAEQEHTSSKTIQNEAQFQEKLHKMHEDRNVKHRRWGSNDGSGFYNNKKDPKENHLLQVPCRTP